MRERSYAVVKELIQNASTVRRVQVIRNRVSQFFLPISVRFVPKGGPDCQHMRRQRAAGRLLPMVDAG
jgi:hypothetical protein